MPKKKRTSLPRLTVLSMNRRDLAAFVGSVETLRLLVEDLRLMMERKKSPSLKAGAKPNRRQVEQFQNAYRAVALDGGADEIGGEEYARVLAEWAAAGFPEYIEAFVRARANWTVKPTAK